MTVIGVVFYNDLRIKQENGVRTMAYSIMVVDDDVNIGNLLQETLEKESYRVIRAYSGTEALMILEKERPDLILLDLMLPGITGEELLAKITDIPTIIMSAKTDLDNKVKLLYQGARDYVTKPFVLSELLARIAVQLRIASMNASSGADEEKAGKLQVGDLTLDTDLLTVSGEGKEISLTRTEGAVLYILMLHANRPLGRNTILDRISDSTPDCTERSLKQHVSNLRKKLQQLDGIDHIEAIYGIGFRYKVS